MRRFYARIFKGDGLRSKSIALLLAFFSFVFGTVSLNAQTITNVTVSGAPVCAGSNVTVSFNAINGGGNLYTNSTVYTLYLSDASGGNYKSLGTFNTTGVSYDNTPTGTTSITFNTNIAVPSNTASGSGYKISIGSSLPLFDGSAGASASKSFTINAL